MVAYLSYTLQMKTLFRIVHDTRIREEEDYSLNRFINLNNLPTIFGSVSQLSSDKKPLGIKSRTFYRPNATVKVNSMISPAHQ